MSATSQLSSIKRDLKKYYAFHHIIDAMPEELFYDVEQSMFDDPSLLDCKSTLTLTRSAMILKLQHKKSKQQIAVYLERKGVRFRIARGSNPNHFQSLTQSIDLDPEMYFLAKIVEGKHPQYNLALSA